MMTRETKTHTHKKQKEREEERRERFNTNTENKEQKNERDFFAKFHIFSLDKKNLKNIFFSTTNHQILSFEASKSHKLYR